jgi:hypothetical protein
MWTNVLCKGCFYFPQWPRLLPKRTKKLLKSFGSTSYLTAHNDLLTFMFSMDCKELDTHLCIVLSHDNGLPPTHTPVFSVYLLYCWHCSRSWYTWSVVILLTLFSFLLYMVSGFLKSESNEINDSSVYLYQNKIKMI